MYQQLIVCRTAQIQTRSSLRGGCREGCREPTHTPAQTHLVIR